MYLRLNRNIGSNLAETLPLKEQTCFHGPKSVLWWEIFLSLRKGHFGPSSYGKEAGSCEVRAVGGQPGQPGLAQRQQSHPIHNQTCNFNTQNKICHIAFVSLSVFHKVILLSGILKSFSHKQLWPGPSCMTFSHWNCPPWPFCLFLLPYHEGGIWVTSVVPYVGGPHPPGSVAWWSEVKLI